MHRKRVIDIAGVHSEDVGDSRYRDGRADRRLRLAHPKPAPRLAVAFVLPAYFDSAKTSTK